ncbi:hypothetical protein PG994_005324 [Apiospora phragmitis]|uniref:Uncharacterized protein n=1 Tax=Apiospora phragmitis TaxID=2905665 RepID=A0ABR1VBZ8_9PEZI
MLGWRKRARDEAFFLRRSTSSSAVRLKALAPDHPREFPCESNWEAFTKERWPNGLTVPPQTHRAVNSNNYTTNKPLPRTRILTI